MVFFETISQFFSNDTEILEFLKAQTHAVQVKKGEIISRAQTYNRNVYFVEKGLLRAFYLENGKDITSNFYTEGKLAANIDTLFQNLPSGNSLEALEDAEIIYCNYENLEILCKVSLPAANFSRYILGTLMYQMSKRIYALQHKTAKEKYEELLEENPNIILRAPLGNIASYLGITQETLSRIRSGK